MRVPYIANLAAWIPDEPADLRRLSANLQWTAITLALCAVAVQVAKHLTDLREKRISAEQSAARDAERVKTDAELNTRAAAAVAAAAKSNEIAEREREARIKLEARMAPRRLPVDAQARLVTGLQSYAGRSVDIFAIGVGREIAEFSEQLESVLSSAGIAVRRWTVMGGASAKGVVFQTRPGVGTADTRLTAALIESLNAAGISAGFQGTFTGDKVPANVTGPTWDPDNISSVRVFVGDKP